MNAITKEFTKEFTDAIEARLEGHETELKTFKEMLNQMEQKADRASRYGGDGAAPNFGAQVANSSAFSEYKSAGFQGTKRFSLKAITSATAGSVYSEIDFETVGLAMRTLRIRDLLTVLPCSTGSVDYARQTTRTNNAAPVAEGALKPTSNYIWEQVTLPIRTIAHLAKLTRQALDDSATLQAEVENEMRYGLGFAEEVELLSGDGTGQHLTGLVPAATAYAAPFTISSPTIIDQIGLAVLQQALTDYPADGIILHPSDWMRCLLTKDAAGGYIFSDPTAVMTPRLFGLPVVPTRAMTVDKFLVGGFKQQKLYDRMAPEVLIASENVDDFEKNMYTMRCEERVGLAIRTPAALIYGDFGFVA